MKVRKLEKIRPDTLRDGSVYTLVPTQRYITDSLSCGVLDESMLSSRQLYWESLWSRTHADSLLLLKRIDCTIGKAIVLKYSQKCSNNTAESQALTATTCHNIYVHWKQAESRRAVSSFLL